MCFYPVAKEIALPTYLKQIGQLLEERRYPEVVLHAQHVLKRYPRHIVTYRLLGQALLEQQDYTGATDLLQRVLSASPSDLIAHLGLAIAYAEEAFYSQAIWHLLHAYEIDPYNVNIQRELRELYRQRDGEYVAGISISPAALARLHFKGGQYQQASAELRQILQADTEERVDWELLLAESLWRNRQRLEAAEVCESVLTKLPNCITANAILGEIYLSGERAAAAVPYLTLVQTLTQVSQLDLDPETTVGAAFSLPGAPALPPQVMIVPLDEQAVATALGLAEERTTPTIAEWVSGYGLEETAVSDENLYDWLEPEATDEAVDEAGAAADSPGWLEPALNDTLPPQQVDTAELEALILALDGREQPDDEDKLPDWLQTGLSSEPSAVEPAEADSFANDDALPEWLWAGETAVDDAQESDGNRHKKQYAVTEDTVAEDKNKKKSAADMAQSDLSKEVPESMDDALAWLDELIGQNEQAPQAAQADDDVPDWLQDLSDQDADQDEAVPNDALPEWLREAALTSETTLPRVLDDDDDPIIEAEISPIDTDLSWLDALTKDSAPVGDDMPTMTWEGGSDEPQDFDEAMAWLEELAAGQKTPIEEPPTIARGLFGTEVLAGKGNRDESVAKPTADKGVEKDDLPQMDADPMDDAMAWLDELAGGMNKPADERPSLAETTRGATNAALQDLDDLEDASVMEDAAMAWLDELALEEETAVSQAPAVADDLADALDWLEAETAGEEPTDDDELVAELPTQAFRQLDDDLAWLEQIALLDEEPAAPVAETAVTDELPDIPANPDETLAWLEQMALESNQASAPAAEMAEPVVQPSAAEVVEEDSTFDVPEDPDEAMAWLEQLAARQGAPLDELPSLHHDEPVASPEMDVDVAEVPEDPDEAMAWLDQLAAQAPDDDLPVTMAETTDTDDDLDAMAWLDELAADAGVEIEQETAMMDETAVSDEAEEDLAAMAWLDELATDAGVDLTAEEETETAVPTVTDVDEAEAAIVEAEASTETADFLAPPDDLDEAMAWLEQLAARQGAPLDELPTVTGEVAVEAGETAVPVTAAQDEDELDAMSWLDELTADAGVELEQETAVVDETAVADEDEDDLDAMSWLDELAADAGVELEVEETEETAIVDVAEDDLAAMAWLDELAANAGVEIETEEAVETAVSAPAVADELEMAVAATESAWSEPPDDLDEAMAWLEQLAAQQGAPLEELPSLHAETPEADTVAVATEPDEAAEAMAWLDELVLDEETAVAETDVAEAESDEPDEDTVEAMAWLEELARGEAQAHGEAKTSAPVAEPEEEDEDAGIPAWLMGEPPDEAALTEALEEELEEPEDVIPDWLTEEPTASLGDTGWLRSLAEPDMAGWLISEEEATTGKLTQDGFGTDALEEIVAPERKVEVEERPFVREPVMVPMDTSEAAALLVVDEDQLTVARGAVETGDVKTAVGTYQAILDSGSGLSVLIADLESATMQTPGQMQLQQILGDAYMRNGQLQKALEAYRQALKAM